MLKWEYGPGTIGELFSLVFIFVAMMGLVLMLGGCATAWDEDRPNWRHERKLKREPLSPFQLLWPDAKISPWSP